MLIIIKETMTGIQKTEQGCPNPGVSEGVSLGVLGMTCISYSALESRTYLVYFFLSFPTDHAGSCTSMVRNLDLIPTAMGQPWRVLSKRFLRSDVL